MMTSSHGMVRLAKCLRYEEDTTDSSGHYFMFVVVNCEVSNTDVK